LRVEAGIDWPKISIVEGDICDREVDAVVNAANNQLWMGGGVAGAIKRRGGQEIEREAVAQGPIEIGASVATKAGALRAGHVIHAAVMGSDLTTDAEKIGRATLSALRLAADMGLASVALPALGTGVGGFPLEECARIMRGALTQHVSEGTTLRTVEFVLFGRDAYAAFAQVFEINRG
jgi:O-acetyl-ADP-ribose deacetylase (regulator of RNase III)